MSIIIPTYNMRQFVMASVRSALSQTYRDLEVLVVDDGSTDDTSSILERSFGDRITLIRQPHDGIGAARNAGLSAARGELIAFLDSDDLFHRDKIARQVTAMRRAPAVGLCHTDAVVFDDSGLLELGPDAWPESRNRTSGWVFERLLLVGNMVLSSSVMVRRAVLERVGTFDKDPTISQDYDLWLRIARYYPFLYLDSALVCYRRTMTGLTRLRPGKARERSLVAFDKAVATLGAELRLPDGAVQERRRHLLVSMGYHYLVSGERKAARDALASALREDPTDLRAAILYAAALLPPAAVARLRTLKALTRRARRALLAPGTPNNDGGGGRTPRGPLAEWWSHAHHRGGSRGYNAGVSAFSEGP